MALSSIWLVGVSPSESNGKTMSEDEDDNQVESEVNMFDGSLDGSDCLMGFGPLVPTERERSLMERVKKELKHELKQVIARSSCNITSNLTL